MLKMDEKFYQHRKKKTNMTGVGIRAKRVRVVNNLI